MGWRSGPDTVKSIFIVKYGSIHYGLFVALFFVQSSRTFPFRISFWSAWLPPTRPSRGNRSMDSTSTARSTATATTAASTTTSQRWTKRWRRPNATRFPWTVRLSGHLMLFPDIGGHNQSAFVTPSSKTVFSFKVSWDRRSHDCLVIMNRLGCFTTLRKTLA